MVPSIMLCMDTTNLIFLCQVWSVRDFQLIRGLSWQITIQGQQHCHLGSLQTIWYFTTFCHYLIKICGEQKTKVCALEISMSVNLFQLRPVWNIRSTGPPASASHSLKEAWKQENSIEGREQCSSSGMRCRRLHQKKWIIKYVILLLAFWEQNLIPYHISIWVSVCVCTDILHKHLRHNPHIFFVGFFPPILGLPHCLVF